MKREEILAEQKKNKNRYKQLTPSKRKKTVGRDLFLAILLSLLLVFFSASFFFQIKKVSGYGMIPTLRQNEWVLIEKRATYKRFDLVLFKDSSGQASIRRLIGLPGENVFYYEDLLYVDGEEVMKNLYFQKCKQLIKMVVSIRKISICFLLRALKN